MKERIERTLRTSLFSFSLKISEERKECFPCFCFFDRHLYSIEIDLSTGNKRKICWWKSGTLINWFLSEKRKSRIWDEKNEEGNKKKLFSHLDYCRNVINRVATFSSSTECMRLHKQSDCSLLQWNIFSEKWTEKKTKKSLGSKTSSLQKTIDI